MYLPRLQESGWRNRREALKHRVKITGARSQEIKTLILKCHLLVWPQEDSYLDHVPCFKKYKIKESPRLQGSILLCLRNLCLATSREMENSSERISISLFAVFSLYSALTKMKKNGVSEAAFYTLEKVPSKRLFIRAFRFTALQTCGNLRHSFKLLSSSLWIQPEVSCGPPDEMLNVNKSKQNRISLSIPGAAPLVFNDIRNTQKPQLC